MYFISGVTPRELHVAILSCCTDHCVDTATENVRLNYSTNGRARKAAHVVLVQVGIVDCRFCGRGVTGVPQREKTSNILKQKFSR